MSKKNRENAYKRQVNKKREYQNAPDVDPLLVDEFAPKPKVRVKPFVKFK